MIAVLRTLGRHTLIYGSGVVLGRVMGFLLLPLYTRFFTPEDYGVFELLDVTSWVVGTFLAFGMQQAVLKYYHSYSEPIDRDRVLSTAILFTAASGLVMTCVLVPARGWLALYLIGSTRYAYLLSLSFAALLVSSLLGLQKTVLRAQHRSGVFTVVSLLHTAIALTLNVYFVAVARKGPAGILYSTLMTSALFAGYLAWRILRESGVRMEMAKLRPMLAYGIYFVPAGLAALVLNWSDRYFLRVYSTLDVVGLYALAYKIAMILTALIEPFVMIWQSQIFVLQQQHDARETYAKVATYFLATLTATALGLAMLAPEIITTMAAPSYQSAAVVVPILVVAMVLWSSECVFQVGLLLKGDSRRLSTARWLAAAANIGLNWVLIPTYGMMGAAVATLISFLFSTLLTLTRAQQSYYVPFEYRRLAHLGLAAGITYAASTILPGLPVWTAVPVKLAVWLLFPALLLASGFLTRSERNAIVRVTADAHRLYWRQRAAVRL